MSIFNQIISNSYFINVFCGILTVALIYLFQVSRCKRKIRNDFRCKEIIDETYIFILNVDEIQEHIKELDNTIKNAIKAEKENNENYSREDEQRIKDQLYQDFFREYKWLYESTMSALVYENNRILLDSVSTVFFININFKVLNLVNNIKNRIPNVQKHYDNIENYVSADYYSIVHMNTDLRFLSDYYKDLFKYLTVNMLLLKARNNVAKKSMKIEDNNTFLSIMDSSFEKRIEYSIDYNKMVKQEYKRLKKESKDKNKFILNHLNKLYYVYVYLKIYINNLFKR